MPGPASTTIASPSPLAPWARGNGIHLSNKHTVYFSRPTVSLRAHIDRNRDERHSNLMHTLDKKIYNHASHRPPPPSLPLFCKQHKHISSIHPTPTCSQQSRKSSKSPNYNLKKQQKTKQGVGVGVGVAALNLPPPTEKVLLFNGNNRQGNIILHF